MIKKILVPLDGSKLAECVLPYVEEMGQKLGAQVVLVSITDRLKGFWPREDPSRPGEIKMIPETVCSVDEQAGKYLDGVAANLTGKVVNVTKEIICGKTAEELTIYANTQHCDLAIMSNHGRNGSSKLTHGKVLQYVLKNARIPILVVKAPGC
jgi:nucleotide-binding universal stress UspA family protein